MLDIASLQPKVAEVAKKHKLTFVALFGSQAVGNIHPKSDIDIAVIGNDISDKNKITADFCSLFEREDVDVVNLANASPTLMHSIVKDGVLLYEKKDNDFLTWKLYAIWVWHDTAWLRQLRDKKLLAWSKTV